MLFREISVGWKKDLKETMKFKKGNAKSCILDKPMP